MQFPLILIGVTMFSEGSVCRLLPEVVVSSVIPSPQPFLQKNLPAQSSSEVHLQRTSSPLLILPPTAHGVFVGDDGESVERRAEILMVIIATSTLATRGTLTVTAKEAKNIMIPVTGPRSS